MSSLTNHGVPLRVNAGYANEPELHQSHLAGAEVPHYCYHPKLPVAGNCRMCLIEMGMPAVDPATKAPIMDAATGKQKINWIPRPQIGC